MTYHSISIICHHITIINTMTMTMNMPQSTIINTMTMIFHDIYNLYLVIIPLSMSPIRNT